MSQPSNFDDKGSILASANLIDLIPKYQDNLNNSLKEKSEAGRTLTEKKIRGQHLQHHVVTLQNKKHVSQLMSPI